MDRFAPARPQTQDVIPVWRPAERTCTDVIILGKEVSAVYTHYFGRSYLCPGEDCPACINGSLPRWVGLLAVGRQTGERAVIEIGAKMTAAIDRIEGASASPNLAGYVIQIRKDRKHDPIALVRLTAERRKVTPVSEHQVLESYFVQLGLPGCGAKEIWDQQYAARIKSLSRRVLRNAMTVAERRIEQNQ